MNANRKFLNAALEAGLQYKIVTPEGILRHITPQALAAHLPVAAKARLLAAGLQAEGLSPTLVIEAVSVSSLVEHMPEQLLWKCLADTAEGILGSVGAGSAEGVPSDKPKAVTAGASTMPGGGPGERGIRTSTARRPNISRRPSRLTSLPTAEATGPEPEFDADMAEEWRLPANSITDTEALGAGHGLPNWSSRQGTPGGLAKRHKP